MAIHAACHGDAWKNSVITRGETHFCICSLVHVHASHVDVHMSQHESSNEYQDKFCGTFGSRKVRVGS